MLNQAIICGRLVANIETITDENEKKHAMITVAVPRSYKNADGEYETDFITCELWNGIAENTMEYCKKGDLLGIKGRLQTNDGKMTLIAEKVTFLSSKKTEE